MSATPPKPSQVESNPTVASALATIEDARGDIEAANSYYDDVIGVLEAVAETIQGLAEEWREKAQNIEDGFGHSTVMSDEFNERADSWESFASDLTNGTVTDPGEPPDKDDFLNEDDEVDEDAFAEAEEEYAGNMDEMKGDALALLDEFPG